MNVSERNNKMIKSILRWFLYICVSFVVLTILLNIFISGRGASHSYYDINSISEYDTAIVFGTTPKALNGLPNSYYTYRIRGAVDLYKAGKIKKILVSGDNRSFRYNEPKAMRKSLEDRGVNKEDIIEDFAGRDTYDSVIRARDVFGLHKHLYITQQFQGDRAIAIASWNNIEAMTYVVPETKDSFVRTKMYIREYLARTKMIFTLLLNVRPDILGKYEPITQSSII